eukprot:3937499-Rhodomonas_salina.2
MEGESEYSANSARTNSEQSVNRARTEPEPAGVVQHRRPRSAAVLFLFLSCWSHFTLVSTACTTHGSPCVTPWRGTGGNTTDASQIDKSGEAAEGDDATDGGEATGGSALTAGDGAMHAVAAVEGERETLDGGRRVGALLSFGPRRRRQAPEP